MTSPLAEVWSDLRLLQWISATTLAGVLVLVIRGLSWRVTPGQKDVLGDRRAICSRS